jgi:hypothetical protein
MEKAQAPLSEELSNDISSTLFALASFITRFNGPACHRIKTKFCVLCDNVCEKTVSLTLRKDGGGRNDILDILMEWIQDLGHVCRVLHTVSTFVMMVFLSFLKGICVYKRTSTCPASELRSSFWIDCNYDRWMIQTRRSHDMVYPDCSFVIRGFCYDVWTRFSWTHR